MKKVTIFIVVACLLAFGATPAYASTPPLPHAFYGNVTINGSPAPTKTTVEARGEGIEAGTYNPITTTEIGKYGGPGGLDPKLVVQGDNIADGATITFYVNGHSTGQTYPFDKGEITELHLSVKITEPSVVVPPALAAFSVTNLSILPAEVPPNQAVTIAVSVVNTGGTEGSYTVILKIDGVKEDEETITVAAGESQDVSFSVTKDEPGTYTVDVDGLSGSFTVVAPLIILEPAAFSVSSLSIQPAEVEPGEAVTITVSVANTGGKSGSYTVILKIDGVKEDEERVTIAAGGSKDVSFSVTREEADTYTVAVDGLSGSFTVVAPLIILEPAAFSVSSLSIQPAEVEPGETVTISVSVANTGGTEGSYTVILQIDGVKEDKETVTVAAGGSQTVSFSVTREDPGSYTVAVDELSGSFTVVPPAKPGINWPLIGGIIGLVIVVALLIYFLWFRRRE